MIKQSFSQQKLGREKSKLSMDQKSQRRLDVMVRMVEPMMLLLIGGMVMFIIIGILLPVFDLNSTFD